MTTEYERPDFYFGRSFPAYCFGPFEGLQDCAAVLEALATLIGDAESLENFQACGNNRSVRGLLVILDSAREGIHRAADELQHDMRTLESERDAANARAETARVGERAPHPAAVAADTGIDEKAVRAVMRRLTETGALPAAASVAPDNAPRAAAVGA